MLSSHISNMYLRYLYTHFSCKTLHGNCNTKTCSDSDMTSVLLTIFLLSSTCKTQTYSPQPSISERLHSTDMHYYLTLRNYGNCHNTAIETEPEESYSWSDWYSETSEKVSERLIGGSWSSLHTISKW